jgi:hypothetical protein
MREQQKGQTTMTRSKGEIPVFAQLEDEYVRCRTLLHAWEPCDEPANLEVQSAFSTSKSVERISFKCLRCKGYRHEGWSKVTGDLLWRVYRLDPSYGLPKGSNATRKRLRREFIARQQQDVRRWSTGHGNGNGKARKAG